MLTTIALTLTTLLPTLAPRPVEDARKAFVAAAAAQDEAACRGLWRAQRGAVLPVIDADLEGSLKVREDAGARALTAQEEQKIASMHARALWGARQADACGHAFVLDYAASFVAWDERQRADFRAGQKAYREARGALEKGDARAALESARRCRELAAPLGDWWGAQMGWEAEARARDVLGEKEAALAAWSRVRLVARALSLVGDEYEASAAVARLAADMKATERAKAALDAALALGRELGDEQGVQRLEALGREKLGLK